MKPLQRQRPRCTYNIKLTGRFPAIKYILSPTVSKQIMFSQDLRVSSGGYDYTL